MKRSGKWKYTMSISISWNLITGDYAYGHYTYSVVVVIKDHRIESIDVHHGRNSEKAKAAEGVIGEIISEQKIDVDVISGATTTSKAILKAVELALSK